MCQRGLLGPAGSEMGCWLQRAVWFAFAVFSALTPAVRAADDIPSREQDRSRGRQRAAAAVEPAGRSRFGRGRRVEDEADLCYRGGGHYAEIGLDRLDAGGRRSGAGGSERGFPGPGKRARRNADDRLVGSSGGGCQRRASGRPGLRFPERGAPGRGSRGMDRLEMGRSGSGRCQAGLSAGRQEPSRRLPAEKRARGLVHQGRRADLVDASMGSSR